MRDLKVVSAVFTFGSVTMMSEMMAQMAWVSPTLRRRIQSKVAPMQIRTA